MSETPMKKQALLIGINEYQILPGLKYARQDAEAVADSLKQNYCFSDNEVMVLTDARPGLFKPTSRYIIQDHLEKLANQDLDLFIFGFWGHGLFRNGKRYLCPLDVMSARAEHQGLPFDELQELLANIKAKNTCLILDCCQTVHDRGEPETLTASDKATMENAARDIILRRKEQIPDFQSNVAILNSCKEGQSAYEWDARQHGLFTAHLLDAMKKRSNSVMQIASYISSNIEKTALELGKEQTPFYKLEGDIVLPVETKSTPLETGDVFISYRHCNADLVAPVEAELKRRGISYFIDRIGVNYGMEYSEALTTAIEKCKLLLLFWTPEVKGSDDIVNEVVLAQKLKKTVVPYKIGNFSEVEHRKLCYHIARLSGYFVSQQTAETIKEIVNKVELSLTGKASQTIVQPPTALVPEPKLEPVDNGNRLAELLIKEKQKKQKMLDQLLNEAAQTLDKEEYALTISKCDEILKLEPNSVEAKELKSLCQSRLDFQKAVEQRKAEETERKRREDVKKHGLSILGTKAGERRTITINGVEFAFRWCPAGIFTMGSPESEYGRYDDEKQHRVTLTKGFWMMETQVTQKQWKAIMSDNPSCFQGDDLPVERISWNDCQDFCKRCTDLGLPVQLPTEAQWEYACRAGSSMAYFGCNFLNGAKANCDNNLSVWNMIELYGNYLSGTTCKGKYLKTTTPVGSYEANAWGLYDMHGNVWEWCADIYGNYPKGSVTDPLGPSNGSSRVCRGGGWKSPAQNCRSAVRDSNNPGIRNNDLGFRCVRSITNPEN